MRLSVIRHGSRRREVLGDRGFALKFSENVRGPPWHRMTATYGCGFGDAVRGVMPEVRDWIAFETRPGFARMLGRIVSPVARMGGGPTSSATVTVDAEGFLDAARGNDVISSPGARDGTIGTLFDYEDWLQRALGPFVDTFQFGDLGPLLQKLVRLLVRMEMPPAMLTGTNLGDAIYVMHEPGKGAGSAAAIKSLRTLDPVRGFNVGGVRSLLKTQGKAVDLLVGTFRASDLLVEMFPSLEPVPPGGVPRSFSGSFEDGFEGGVPPEVLGNYLTVVYRFKPWRSRALSLAIKEGIADASPPATFFTPAAYPDDPFAFDRETWTAAHEARAPLVGAPFEFTAGKRNDDIVNGASAWLTALGGGDDLRVFKALGLPLLRPSAEIERDGFRMASVNWPFMPSAGTSIGAGAVLLEQDLFAFVQRLAAAVMQLYQPAADLFSGQFTTGLDLRVRAGEIARVPVPGGGPMAVYVEKVEHDLQVDEAGGVKGTTMVEFSRGAFDMATRDRDVVVPEVIIPAPDSSSGTGDGIRHDGLIFDGKPYPIILDWDVKHPELTVEVVPGDPTRTVTFPPVQYTVESKQRVFVFGDTDPSDYQIQNYRTQGPDLPPAVARSGWPIVAAAGESFGNPTRPSVERQAIALGYNLRVPGDIDMVVIHSPGDKIYATARYSAAGTYVTKMDAAVAANSPRLGVAAQFVIDRRGCVWQLMDGYRYAPHALGSYNGVESADIVNRRSIGIDLVVPSRNMTRDMVDEARSRQFELPAPTNAEWTGRDSDGAHWVPTKNNGTPIVEGGAYPEGGLVPVRLQRQMGLGDYTGTWCQPSRQQYRALGALLSVIKGRCPNFQLRFPEHEGMPEFTWRAIAPRLASGAYDGAELPAGIYTHACLDKTRTDHLALNRARVLAYSGSVDETRNRRNTGDAT